MVTESALQFSLFKSKTHFFGPASARSYKISFVGNNWFVGNAVFWETAVSIFLIFCMKLRGYKGRKVTEPDFWNKFLIWRYSEKRLQISPKSDILIFLKNGSNDLFSIWPEVSTKYDVWLSTKLNKTYFSERVAIWRYLTSKSSKFGCFLTIHRSSQCIFMRQWFCYITCIICHYFDSSLPFDILFHDDF